MAIVEGKYKVKKSHSTNIIDLRLHITTLQTDKNNKIKNEKSRTLEYKRRTNVIHEVAVRACVCVFECVSICLVVHFSYLSYIITKRINI